MLHDVFGAFFYASTGDVCGFDNANTQTLCTLMDTAHHLLKSNTGKFNDMCALCIHRVKRCLHIRQYMQPLLAWVSDDEL